MELAFWRPQRGGGLEVVSAHPNGVAQIEVGTVVDGRISLSSATVARSPTAKDISHLERSFVVNGDLLTYEVRMAAMGHGLEPHLEASLRRASTLE